MNTYLKSCKTKFWKNIFEKELGYILKELTYYKDILSVGCGPAIIEGKLLENGYNVTGLDISKEALDGAPDSLRAVIGSAEQMNFTNANFDAVIYIASLQFINNYEKAIQETSRILRPKGKLLVMLLNPRSNFFEEKRKKSNSYINKIKESHIETAPIEKVIQKYFDAIKTEYYLGITGEKIFSSNDPKLTALYIIQGNKK